MRKYKGYTIKDKGSWDENDGRYDVLKDNIVIGTFAFDSDAEDSIDSWIENNRYADGGYTNPQLSFDKVDYDVNVTAKKELSISSPPRLMYYEVDVNIKESDSVNHSALNDTDAKWSQYSWGYMIFPKSTEQLYDVLKALKTRVSKKRLIEWANSGGYAKGGETENWKYKRFDEGWIDGEGYIKIAQLLPKDEAYPKPRYFYKNFSVLGGKMGWKYKDKFEDDEVFIPRKNLDNKWLKSIGFGKRIDKGRMFAQGGKTQGYDDKLDESLGMRDGAEKDFIQTDKDRRDESKGEEKALGRRAYASVETMDRADRIKQNEKDIDNIEKEYQTTGLAVLGIAVGLLIGKNIKF